MKSTYRLALDAWAANVERHPRTAGGERGTVRAVMTIYAGTAGTAALVLEGLRQRFVEDGNPL